MTNPLKACDLKEAETLHRESLAKIVIDMAYWLKGQRAEHKTKSARLRKSKKLAEARAESEVADIYDECFQKLRSLRAHYGEASARQSFFRYAHDETKVEQVLTDPTPEEIAEITKQIQSKWCESKRDHACTEKTRPVEVRLVKTK